MVSQQPEVIIREATEADYEGVIAILPDLYSGRDYLPAFYHDMIKDPKRFMVLAELHGEIIGFGMNYVVDSDQVSIEEALRVKEDYRGKGVYKQIKQYALSSVLQKYPMVKSSSFASQNEGRMYKFLHNPLKERYSYKHAVEIESESIAFIKKALSSPELEVLSKGLAMTSTELLTPSGAVQELDKLIDDKDILNEHAWMVNYEPFKPMHSNHVTMTHHNTRGQPAVMVSKADKRNEVIAISFGTVTPIRRGVTFKIDFYCHKAMRQNERGTVLLHAHMMKHLVLFHQLRGNFMRVAFDVLLPKEMDPDNMFEFFTRVGVTDYKVMNRKFRSYLVEEKLETYIRSNL